MATHDLSQEELLMLARLDQEYKSDHVTCTCCKYACRDCDVGNIPVPPTLFKVMVEDRACDLVIDARDCMSAHNIRALYENMLTQHCRTMMDTPYDV